MQSSLERVLIKHQSGFHPIIKFDPFTDRLATVDLTENSADLPPGTSDQPEQFRQHMDSLRAAKGATLLIGGYNELRSIYGNSSIFDAKGEPRRLHLGVDIWAPPGTPIYAYSGGMVHSTAFNQEFGDYGATLILLHQLEGISFYTLYGHVSLHDIQRVSAGQYLSHGQEIARIGEAAENGGWPPHLHFQVITDLGGRLGDFPGVCRLSEKERWLANCPDPELILQMKKWLINPRPDL